MNKINFLPALLLLILASSNNVLADVNAAAVHQNEQAQHGSAIQIILDDHYQVRSMIQKIEGNLDTDVANSRQMVNDLKSALVKHETMEQKVWYPALEKNHENLKGIIQELEKEEKRASAEIKSLDKVKDDKEWVVKVKKLINDVKHHADEEEIKLFPEVEKTVDKGTLDQIGNKMKEFKESKE